MARPSSALLTERETQLMEILWTQGPSTAEAVREALPDKPHDSTVRTLLRILKTKGYVRLRGRQPVVYEPAVARAAVQKRATRSFLAHFFGGSVEALVMRMVDDEDLSPEELEKLRKLLAQHKRKEQR